MDKSNEMPAGEASIPDVPESRIPTEAHSVPLILLTVFAVVFIIDRGPTGVIQQGRGGRTP